MLLQRALLYLGGMNANDNGRLIVRLIIDDPAGTLVDDLLNDAVSVTVIDADSS